MPQVLTTNAIVLCAHGGPGTTTPLSPIFPIHGGYVCAEGDPGTLACPFLAFPCVGYTLVSMGFTKSTLDGRRIILTTDFNQSFTGLPLTLVETHTVVDDSTTVPIPPGESAPPLPPALLDQTKPLITVVPPALAFNTVSAQPSVVSATFTVSHPFPSRWLLTLISEPHARSKDVTAGMPPGLTVTPADGRWNSSFQVVQVTMTAAYMATLGFGQTHFYLTAVSERGMTECAELLVTVT